MTKTREHLSCGGQKMLQKEVMQERKTELVVGREGVAREPPF
jgi:hypothetical protein